MTSPAVPWDELGHTVSDDELEALALAHPVDGPEPVWDDEARPAPFLTSSSGLPPSYLPGAMAGPQRRWMGPVALLLIAMFLLITALGFCSTYGQLVFA